MSDRAASLITAILVAAIAIGLWLNGADYYGTPVAQRAASPLHAELAPSHPTGHLLGWLGLAAMVLLLAYSVRKRARWLRRAGPLRHWLWVHILLGLIGPLLVTYHSAFKVGGLVSIAYWSMMVTMLSGIFGRYIYVQIPSSLLGERRSPEALGQQVRELETQIAGRLGTRRDLVPPAPVPVADAPAGSGSALRTLVADDLRRPLRRLRLSRELHAAGLDRGDARAVAGLVQRRDLILRRVALSASLSEAFRYWHALHKPFVYIMFLIAAVHVGIAFLLGYTGLPWTH